MKIYKCDVCGQIIMVAKEGKGQLKCCEKEMELLEANTTDASKEKHIPKITKDGKMIKVEIGEITHPMTLEHYIAFIIVKTNQRAMKFDLNDKPMISFGLDEKEEIQYVESYCNLHGLWKK